MLDFSLRVACARAVAFSTAASLLVACGGGSTPSPAVARSASSGTRGTARITIKIPKAPSTPAARTVKYLSPATSQMVVNIEQSGTPISGYPQTVSLTPTSNGCSSTLASTNCSLSIALSPGSYTATLTAQDASGTALSAVNAIPFTILAGQANTISLVLGGLPASLQAVPVTAGYLRGDSSALHLWGAATQQLALEALDADGNAIVGPGAPTYSVTSGNTGALTAAIPNPTIAPNIVSLGATGGAVTPGTVELTVGATPASGAGGSSLSLVIPLTLAHSVVYVSDGEYIYAYYDGSTSVTYEFEPGFSYPRLAADRNGTLYATDASGNSVLEYPEGATSPSVTLTGSGLDDPGQVALDPAGDIFVLNGDSGDSNYNTVEFPAGSTTGSTIISSSAYTTDGIAVDVLGNVYEPTSNILYEYAAGSWSQSTIGGIIDPNGMAFANATDLYVPNYDTCDSETGYGVADVNVVTRTIVNPSPVFCFVNAGGGPQEMAFDAAGNLWVALDLYTAPQVVREYLPSGAVGMTLDDPTYEGSPNGVAVVPPANAPY